MSSDKKNVVLGIIWNWGGLLVGTLVGFILAPFLIHQLGQTLYGLWTVIAALTSYFGLLELGVRRSVGRQIAFHQARHDSAKVNQTVSTALAILGSLGLAAFLGVLACLLVFFQIFEVPADQVENARLALILVGLNLALTLVLDVFDATLWGLQRFDLINGIEMPTTLARAGLTVFFISQGGGLVTLAWITLGLTLVQGLAKTVASFLVNRTLRAGPHLFSLEAIKEIFSYSIWNFLGSIVTLTRQSLSPILIGALMGVAFTTAFSVVTRLTGLAASVLTAATGGLIPWATGIQAQNDRDQEKQLFLLGGRYSTLLACYFFAALALLGGPLVELWIGPELLYAVPLLLILALGECLPNTQYVTSSMIFAAARHVAIAYLALIETVLVVLLMFLLVGSWGLVGAGLALAIPGTLFRGLAFFYLGCRLARVSPWQGVRQTILAPLACSIPPALFLAAAVALRKPDSWPLLFLFGAGYSLLHGFFCALIFERTLVKWLADRILNKFIPGLQARKESFPRPTGLPQRVDP